MTGEVPSVALKSSTMTYVLAKYATSSAALFVVFGWIRCSTCVYVDTCQPAVENLHRWRTRLQSTASQNSRSTDPRREVETTGQSGRSSVWNNCYHTCEVRIAFSRFGTLYTSKLANYSVTLHIKLLKNCNTYIDSAAKGMKADF